MEYQYKATKKDMGGEIVSGKMEAKDKFELSATLRAKNLTLINAIGKGENKFKEYLKKLSEFGSVSMTEKINFGRNLASMLEAGLALSRAVSVMERQNKNKKFKRILREIGESIKIGDSLNKALADHPKTFSPLFISMIRAGEESGNLTESLKIVSSQMDKTHTLKKRIRGAMIYPGVIVFAMTVIGIFMLVFIVPTLTGTFRELDVELPKSTQFIITLSDLLKNNPIIILLLLAGLGFLVSLGFKTERGRRIMDFVFLHMPLISPLVKQTNSARTARTLSSLLASGVPYLKAIQITKDVMQNSYYKKILSKAEKNIQLGLPVSKIFSENEKYYPIFVGEMIAVGEETGELSEMLMRVSTFYETEVEEKTKNLSTIVAPFLMIIVGAAVGFFAISMISPMYSLVENI